MELRITVEQAEYFREACNERDALRAELTKVEHERDTWRETTHSAEARETALREENAALYKKLNEVDESESRELAAWKEMAIRQGMESPGIKDRETVTAILEGRVRRWLSSS